MKSGPALLEAQASKSEHRSRLLGDTISDEEEQDEAASTIRDASWTNGDDEDGEVEAEEGDGGMQEASENDDGVAEDPQISLMEVMDLVKVDREPLNEKGYLGVAGLRSDRKMERFVSRLAGEMKLHIVDVGGLKGTVPYYSGRKATQSFAALKTELLHASKMRDGWLVRHGLHHKARKRTTHALPLLEVTKKRKQRRTKGNLLQTSGAITKKTKSRATRARKRGRESSEDDDGQDVSLLSFASTKALKAVHEVPDVVVGLFGSRAIIVICSIVVLSFLFCVDDKKAYTECEDPLDTSPTPPPLEDHIVTANLKLVKGGKLRPPDFQS